MSECGGSKSPFVVEARDLDVEECDLPDGEFPVEAVTWPDGRVDFLPHTCVNLDLGPGQLLAGRTLIHVGSFNVNAGMPSGYMSADLGQLRGDVFYSRAGDIDELTEAWYLRGVRREAIEYWTSDLMSERFVLPWAELILCSHYGLLRQVPTYESSYGVNLFDDASLDISGVMLDFYHDLDGKDMDWLVHSLEAGGCTWPGQVARKDPDACAAWEARVGRWVADYAG